MKYCLDNTHFLGKENNLFANFVHFLNNTNFVISIFPFEMRVLKPIQTTETYTQANRNRHDISNRISK